MILVISSKNSWAAKRLAKEAEKAGVGLKFVNANKVKGINPKDYTALYVRNPYVNSDSKYLLDVVKLAKKFKRSGKKVVDSIITTGDLARGKWVDYNQMKKAALQIPKTKLLGGYPLPTTNYPLIFKWIYGMKGKNVYLVEDLDELKQILPLHPKKEWLVQEFIKADYEYKVITVGYKALPMVSRFKINNNGFRIDFKQHKTIKSQLLPKVIKLAEKAAKILGRELAKVDILEANGKFYILEVNRFPGLEWYEELTKINASKAFLSYLSRH